MTTEREKIINLAGTDKFCRTEYAGYVHECYKFSEEELITFYHTAQAEAFEQTAVKCKSMLLENEADHSEGAIYNATLNDCIDAIREMAKEMK